MLPSLYNLLYKPLSSSEDDKRREFILYVLLSGLIALSFVALIVTTYNKIIKEAAYRGASPILMLFVLGVFLGLYRAARKGYSRPVAYLFIGICFTVTTIALIQAGTQVAQAILTYSLIVVMAGVLIGAVVSFVVAGGMTFALFIIQWRANTGQSTDGNGLQFVDVMIYCITFIVIALVSWLSNREIERSLNRARQSEKDLEKERNSLETKVRKRTKEIEKIQMEKMLELNRYAEFGRYTANLLHDLSNPLTAVSLNLDQIQDRQKSGVIRRIQTGIEYMEQSIEAARRQLNSKREIRKFDTEEEVVRVVSLLESKAQKARVEVITNLAKGATILGDVSYFDQVVANLVANAIDACEAMQADEKRKSVVKVTTLLRRDKVELRVKDNGTGICEEALAHIFEAFYTTKDAGHGTGIGLAIVKTTVEDELKGTISVMSSEGSGTEMKVTLPLV